ncbi:peroxiredoxin family protein [Gimesia maris]|uniref:peroxiredoxin family protein n=1 Tax=Gimesia maris TaxID=122 RepID=UPI0032EED6DB|tara:strand:- start:39 stop:626 length:588 start_codon:yes stop_codon:yes gene_type:complete
MYYRFVSLFCICFVYVTGGFAVDGIASDGFQRTSFDSPKQVAEHWDARNQEGKKIVHSKLKGSPCVIVLFRGHGCYHCVKQLGEIVEIESRFRSRGVRLIAVSDESVEEMGKALRNRPLPFPVLSDVRSKLARFLGSDKIENWHGILILDSNGEARWLLCGSKPLMDFREVLSQIDSLQLSTTPLETHGLESRVD